MPTYEYACTGCGTRLEVVQRFGDEPLRRCGVCGGTLRKVFHPAGIVFKGSGFYATDSKGKRGGKEEPKKATGGAGKGDHADKDGGTTKPDAAEAKPAAKEKSA